MEKLKMRFLLLLICCSTVFANESGNIMGVVKDLETEEPLIGANVIIKGTATGAATDYEGRYFIQGVEPGVISLSVSYIGYENKTINDIEVLSGETINKNIDMNKDVVSIKGVQVTAKKKTGSDIESLSSKQNALEMQDNISSDQISKSGEIELTESQDEFFWKLSVSDGVIDIKSKFYPYDGYKRFALDFIYKNIAKEERQKQQKLLAKKKLILFLHRIWHLCLEEF